MDREIVFLVLVLLVSGPLLFAGGAVRLQPPRARSAIRLERLRWTQLWLTLTPVAVGVAAIGGWVLVEPEDSEVVPWALFAAATPSLVIWLRAVARAVWALASVFGDHRFVLAGIYAGVAVLAIYRECSEKGLCGRAVGWYLPQAFVVLTGAIGALVCIAHGSYADGVPRSVPFIMRDQAIYPILAFLYFRAISRP